MKLSRNLACVFTPNETIFGHYLALLDAFKKDEGFRSVFPDINNIQKDYLELYLKRVGVFSTFLHDFPFGQEDVQGIKNEWTIKGPMVFIVYFKRGFRDLA